MNCVTVTVYPSPKNKSRRISIRIMQGEKKFRMLYNKKHTHLVLGVIS